MSSNMKVELVYDALKMAMLRAYAKDVIVHNEQQSMTSQLWIIKQYAKLYLNTLKLITTKQEGIVRMAISAQKHLN